MKNKIYPWVELPTQNGHCIVALKAVPESDEKVPTKSCMFRIYTAWDWENSVQQGIFTCFKSDKLFADVNLDTIKEAADYGQEMRTEDAKKLFPELFSKKEKEVEV